MDESTPLIQNAPPRRPIPKMQFFILLLIMISEPITSSIINPFVNQLVNETGITGGNFANVGFYVGIIESIFFVTEAIMTMRWGRLSDSVGRKPILLLGTIGLASSMVSFGLSTKFWSLVASRALSGALNGNVGVSRAMVAEMCDPESIAKVAPYMSIVWELGLTIGPLLGGSLAHPYERFGGIFRSTKFWEQYPYFLPCLSAASCSISAFILGMFFLKETRRRRIRISFKVPSIFKRERTAPSLSSSTATLVSPSESESAKASTSRSPSTSEEARSTDPPTKQYTTTSLLILMRHPFMNYALLTLIDISFVILQALVYATPVKLGGLGLPPHTIGYILGSMGISNTLFQLMFFEKLHRRFGAKNLFTTSIACYSFVFALFPLANFFARSSHSHVDVQGTLPVTTWLTVLLQCLSISPASTSLSSIFLIINAASPPSALGAANGLAQTTASVMRAIGPAGTATLFATSVVLGSGAGADGKGVGVGSLLVYAVAEVVTLGTVYLTRFLPDA